MDDLLSAQYVIALDNPEPSNYTRIPNILKHLTYDEIDPDTEKVTVRRLSVFACHLYSVLKDFAGEENVCWRNTANIAEAANMSEGAVIKCKRELQQKFHQLDNTPLIEITEHKKAVVKSGEKITGTTYHKTLIKHIWGYNRAFFLKIKLEKKLKARASHSPHESDDPSHSPHESDYRRTDSPGECNNTPCSKTPLSKQQHSTAAAVSVCSSQKEADVLATDPKTRVFNWLTKHGCTILRATQIAMSYSLDELNAAIDYTKQISMKKKKKNESLENPLAYILKALENRWWEATS